MLNFLYSIINVKFNAAKGECSDDEGAIVKTSFSGNDNNNNESNNNNNKNKIIIMILISLFIQWCNAMNDNYNSNNNYHIVCFYT